MSGQPGRHTRRTHLGVACRLVSAVAVGVLGVGYPVAVQAAAGGAAASTAPGQADAPRLTASQASARAQSTGKPTVATALTTPTSQTTARPGGLFTTNESLVPVRAYRDGAWRPLNPALHRTANRTLAPAVTTAGLALSGGGSTPLAVMTSHGRSLTLWWPTRLPVPSVSGATATYHNVLPGVDLVVTVDPQGGISDDLVIKNARAAANPALASLRLRASAPNLKVTADHAGDLRVAASPAAEPAFTAQAPEMWDSAPPAAGTAVVSGPAGTLVAAPSGLPAYSSAAGPGAGAHVSMIPLRAAGNLITLTPSRTALTAPDLVFPVYLDPSFEADPVGEHNTAWTEVVSGYPTSASDWDESSDLQVGLCNFAGCNGIGVARSFFRMPLPSQIKSTTSVNSANMYMTEVWSASCTKESVRLYAVGGIGSSTTWDNQPSWPSSYAYQDLAFGYSSSCPASTNDVTWRNLASLIHQDAVKGWVGQTFGLRAASETNDLFWKQFRSGASNITLSVSYHNPPNKPSGLENQPAGACKTSLASEAAIGNDDISLSATVGDVDNANGDDSLSTTFTVKSASTNASVYTATVSSGNAAGGLTVSTGTIARTTVEGWQSGGATKAYSYYWTAVTKDAGNPVLTSPTSETCYFLFNPLGPSAPGLSVSASSVTLGQQFSATISPPSGCSASTTPCPTSYVYQLGVGKPVTVTPNNAPASGDWTGGITMTHVGPIELTAFGMAAGGNPGLTSSVGMTGSIPSTPYPDGYFSGGSYPSLLTLGTGADPSLWLSAGTGNGTLAAPVDIGSLGTAINPGTDGPGDWTGAEILHGDFTGNDVQDVMAYYPSGNHAGVGVIIGGAGDVSPLVPSSGNNWTFPNGALIDPTYANFDNPSVLVGAGDASEQATGLDDLIGILGDTNSSDGGTGYELDLYSATTRGEYGWDEVLSTTAPDGTADWNNYALATAQPGGDPDEVVLLALDKATGALYESVNPTCSTTVTTGCGQSPATLVGMDGTWTQLSVPWGTSAPDLVSADMNNAGQIELWTMSGSTAMPYTVGVGGTAVAQEGPGSAVAYGHNDWQLTDGDPLALGSGSTTATDSITGAVAAMVGGYTWQADDNFSTVAAMDGSTSYIVPPSGTIASTDTTPTLSIWFRTSIPLQSDGVLVSMQSQPLSSGSTIPGGYNPVMYVGTDGKLHAAFWSGSTAIITSAKQVNDGLWHHAVLTSTGSSETLAIDGVVQGSLSGTISVSGNPNLDFGAGYIGGGWPDETHGSSSSNTGYLTYFNGEIADITITS